MSFLLSTPSEAQTDWVRNSEVDPMTDQTIRTAAISVSPNTTTRSQMVSLVLRCDPGDQLKIYFDWGTTVETQTGVGRARFIFVMIRFDDKTPYGHHMTPANDYQGSFVAGLGGKPDRTATRKFLKQMLASKRMIARTTAFYDGDITATFDLSDLEEGASNVLQQCG